MRKQDQLQELIHGLSTNEKRHFKLQTSLRSGDKSYVQLFDLLNEMEVYHTETFSHKTGKSKAALAHSKEHLKDMLLRSLRSFHEDSFATSYYNRCLEEIELLQSKGQYVWAFARIEKALEQALEEDVFAHALMLFRWHHNVAYYVGKGSFNAQIISKEKKTERALFNEMEYQHLLYRFNYLLNEGNEMTKGKAGKQLSALMHSKLLTDKKKAISNSAKVIFHRIHAMNGLYITRQLSPTEEHFKAAIEIFNKNPALLRAKSRVYCILASGLFGLQNSHGQYARAAETLNHFERTLLREKYFSKSTRHYGFTLLILGRLYNYAYSGQYTEAINYSENIQQQQKNLLKQAGASFKFDFTFVTALSYWKTGNLKNAHKLSQRLMLSETNTANVSVLINRFLFLLIQFDLGHYDSLPYLVKNNYRWCSQQKISDGDIGPFNRMIKECCKAAGNKEEVASILENYRAYFTNSNSNIFETLELKVWIEQKIQLKRNR